MAGGRRVIVRILGPVGPGGAVPAGAMRTAVVPAVTVVRGTVLDAARRRILTGAAGDRIVMAAVRRIPARRRDGAGRIGMTAEDRPPRGPAGEDRRGNPPRTSLDGVPGNPSRTSRDGSRPFNKPATQGSAAGQAGGGIQRRSGDDSRRMNPNDRGTDRTGRGPRSDGGYGDDRGRSGYREDSGRSGPRDDRRFPADGPTTRDRGAPSFRQNSGPPERPRRSDSDGGRDRGGQGGSADRRDRGARPGYGSEADRTPEARPRRAPTDRSADFRTGRSERARDDAREGSSRGRPPSVPGNRASTGRAAQSQRESLSGLGSDLSGAFAPPGPKGVPPKGPVPQRSGPPSSYQERDSRSWDRDRSRDRNATGSGTQDRRGPVGDQRPYRRGGDSSSGGFDPAAGRRSAGRSGSQWADRGERPPRYSDRDDRGAASRPPRDESLGSRVRAEDLRETWPDIPEWVDRRELGGDVLRDLRGLSKPGAEFVADHLVAAGALADDEPELAWRHARAARSQGGRVAVVRETVGLVAYRAGEWAEAISELRAARRMGGGPGHLPVMADSERALGHPERAIELSRSVEATGLDPAAAAELTIVVAGARSDLGQHDAALVGLRSGAGSVDPDAPYAARLYYAYADLLARTGRRDEAVSWFIRAADVDADEETDAAERLEEFLDEADGEPNGQQRGEPTGSEPGKPGRAEPGEPDADDERRTPESDDAESDAAAAADAGPADAGPAEAEPADAGPDYADPDDAGPDDAGPDDAGPGDAESDDVAAADAGSADAEAEESPGTSGGDREVILDAGPDSDR